MTDHCFISYSTADAKEFARKLANKLVGGAQSVPVWIDQDHLIPGNDWDTQIDEALKTCKLVLFVMSEDSVMENSVCKQEWSRALSYKKPIIPLWFQNDINVPFRLSDRQRIDFRDNFDSGLARLRDHISWMDSPEGHLRFLRDRLADAQRDLHRAGEVDQPRIQAEIDDLKTEIKAKEVIKKDPEKAKQQTRRNINAGLERDRQPINPASGKATSKFINPRPGSIPDYFEGRFVETEEIADFLRNDFQRIMTINGRAGSGKTVLACRVLQHLENGQFPNDLGEFKVGGIVYLSEISNYRINVANIFSGLLQLIETEKASRVEGLYKEGKIPVDEKIRALLGALPTEPAILLLDNFENLLEVDDTINDQELHVALKTILQSDPHRLKILITTRVLPREFSMMEPARQYIKHLDEGLPAPFAENVLRQMDKDGHAGFRSASDELLGRVREATLGYPRALESLYAILRVDRYSNVEELLIEGLPDTVVEKFVGEAFSRLDINSQKIIQTLAVYNRPVSSAAIDFALQFHISGINSAPILERLVSMHFVRREAKRYFLHPADREYALSRMASGNPDKRIGQGARARTWDQHSLTLRAADYFVEVRKPRAEWKKLDDLSPQLAEFDLRCAAGDYDTAADLLTDIDFDYLLLWGHYRLLIDLHIRVKDKLIDGNLRMSNLNGLGFSHQNVGKVSASIEYYRQGLEITREVKNRHNEVAFLSNLANSYSDLGDERKAIEFYEQALVIAREIGKRKDEGKILNNLGNRYRDLNNAENAIESYKQALVIARETGDRKGESYRLGNIGYAFLILQELQQAAESFLQSIQVADDISNVDVQNRGRFGLAQTYLFQNDLVNARATIEAALQYDVPENNHNITALHGIIALRQGEKEIAAEAFTKSIAQADEILAKTPDYYEALDAKWLALSGLTICDLRLKIDDGRQTVDNGQPPTDYRQRAIETFRKAREIAPHAGVVKRVLQLFDELVKCDEEGILKDVRKAVQGKE